MRSARCVRLEADVDTRVALLLEDYAHFVEAPAALAAKLDLLRDLHGAERIAQWREHLGSGRWRPLVRDLLENHYDPAYRRSLFRNYRDAQGAAAVPVTSARALRVAAKKIKGLIISRLRSRCGCVSPQVVVIATRMSNVSLMPGPALIIPSMAFGGAMS